MAFTTQRGLTIVMVAGFAAMVLLPMLKKLESNWPAGIAFALASIVYAIGGAVSTAEAVAAKEKNPYLVPVLLVCVWCGGLAYVIWR